MTTWIFVAYDENSFSKFVRYHNLYKRLGWNETMSILKIFIGCSNQAKVKKRRSRFYRPLWWCVYCTSSSLTVFDLHSIACVDCDEIRHEVESYSTFKLLRNAFTRHSGKRIVSNRNDSGFKLNTSKHNISLMIHFRLPWGEPWSDHHQNRRRSVWDRPPSLEEMHHEQTDSKLSIPSITTGEIY